MRQRTKARHVPQRSCVGCRAPSAKRELVRLVRSATGAVEPDPTGKRDGRGAYLCHSAECWKQAVKGGRLENALRTKLSPQNREALLYYGAAQLAAEVS